MVVLLHLIRSQEVVGYGMVKTGTLVLKIRHEYYWFVVDRLICRDYWMI